MQEISSISDHEQSVEQRPKPWSPHDEALSPKIMGWFLDALCRQGVRPDAELYVTLWFRGLPLPARQVPQAWYLDSQEELELLRVIPMVTRKLIFNLGSYWVIFLPDEKPFQLPNKSGTLTLHDNDKMLRGYWDGYDHFNEILTRYVSARLSSPYSLSRFDR